MKVVKDFWLLLGNVQQNSSGPLGLRRLCSQSCTLRKLTPIKPAKVDCGNFNLARITCGAAGSLRVWVCKVFLPALWALISWIPSRISWPILRLTEMHKVNNLMHLNLIPELVDFPSRHCEPFFPPICLALFPCRDPFLVVYIWPATVSCGFSRA